MQNCEIQTRWTNLAHKLFLPVALLRPVQAVAGRIRTPFTPRTLFSMSHTKQRVTLCLQTVQDPAGRILREEAGSDINALLF